MITVKLFLDDYRSPSDCISYMDKDLGPDNVIYNHGMWTIVRNYDQFVLYIKKISPQIIKALNQKNWAEAARLYNGASYKQNKYDLLLEKHYKKFKDE